jgi:predicted flap endonuclease-1-like 5' DNA nuclease
MKEIKFSLPLEALGEAESAQLLGDFNNWDQTKAVDLIEGEEGLLQATVELEEGNTYEYRYLLSDGRWINDEAAQEYVYKEDFQIENSVITVPVEPRSKPSRAGKETKKATETKSKKGKIKTAEKESAGTKDKLTRIEGIGAKIEKLLETENILSFSDLSKTPVKKLKAILAAAGPKFNVHDPASWPKQARLAADDKWEKLAKLQETLKGGK